MIAVFAIDLNFHILAQNKVLMESVSVTTKCVTETERSVPFRPFREIVRSVLQRLVKDSVKNSKSVTEDSAVFAQTSFARKE